MKRGFFVPNSIGENYVASKQTADGTNFWDKANDEVSLGKYAAVQSINKQYSTTIDSAYSSYLMASRGIKGSSMGEGYKDAYSQVLQDQLANQVAETGMNAASVRQELNQNAATMQDMIAKAYDTETANMDRVFNSANDYLTYLKSLSGSVDPTKKYLTADQEALSIDDMYETVFNAQPRDYIDQKGELAMSYLEWVNANLKGTDADNEWSKWLFSMGGFKQAQAGVKKGIKK